MKSRIFALVFAATLVLSMPFAFIGCQTLGSSESKIDSVTSSNQKTNGADYTNYTVIVKSDVNWNALSTTQKQEIIEAGFAQARAKAQVDGKGAYNILGSSQIVYNEDKTIKSGGEILFFYDRDSEEVILYSDGEPNGERIPAPAPK